MMSQPGKETIAIHVLPFISRSKDNQAVKFGQLKEYNMRKILPEKSYSKYGRETSPKPFSKKSTSLDQWSKVLNSLFILYAKLKAIEVY